MKKQRKKRTANVADLISKFHAEFHSTMAKDLSNKACADVLRVVHNTLDLSDDLAVKLAISDGVLVIVLAIHAAILSGGDKRLLKASADSIIDRCADIMQVRR